MRIISTKQVKVAITFALMMVCGWLLWRDRALLGSLSQARWEGICLVMGFMLIFLWLNGLVLNIMLEPARVRLGVQESFHLSVMTNAGNALLPLSAGVLFRAHYLKTQRGVSFGYFMGSLLGIYIVNFLLVFLIGALTLAVLYLSGGRTVVPLLVFFASAALGMGALLWKPELAALLPETLKKRARTALEGWRSLIDDRRLLLKLFVLLGANIFVAGGMAWASFFAIGSDLGLAESLVLSVTSSLGLFVKLTPGNLGVNELLFVLGGRSVGLDPGITVLATAVSRAAQYATMLLMLPLSLHALYGKSWKLAIREAMNKGSRV